MAPNRKRKKRTHPEREQGGALAETFPTVLKWRDSLRAGLVLLRENVIAAGIALILFLRPFISGKTYEWSNGACQVAIYCLFGLWMCMYGLVNLASRWVLSRAVFALGAYYILAGTVCLLVVNISFLNPWPMGLVFFAGELLGGFLLYSIRKPDGSIRAFFGF